MIDPRYIPLADAEEWFRFLPILIFLAIGVVGKVLQKKTQEREQQRLDEDQARRRRESARARQEPPARSARQPQPQGPPPVRQQAARPQVAQAQAAARPHRIPHGEGAEDVAQRQSRRIERESRRRSHRLEAREPPEADSTAIESELVSVHSEIVLTEPAKRPDSRLLAELELRSRDDLRRAILYYEIFSTPKALREGPEMWDA